MSIHAKMVQGALVIVELSVSARGLRVFEEHGFMIDEEPEDDSLLSLILLEMWKTGVSDLPF